MVFLHELASPTWINQVVLTIGERSHIIGPSVILSYAIVIW